MGLGLLVFEVAPHKSPGSTEEPGKAVKFR
jgi:hypothetical protein